MALGGGLLASGAGAWWLAARPGAPLAGVGGAGARWLAGWLIAASVVTALLFGVDKLLARRGRRRISERALLGMAAAGGSPGALLAMPLFRHKRVKSTFRRALFGVLALQALVLGGLWWWLRGP